MSQRDVILPVTKIFTVASGVTKSVSLEDTAGASVNVTYATLIDLSGGVAVNVGPTPDVDQASTSSLGSTAWMRLAPGNFSGTNWQYKAYTSGVGYSSGGNTSSLIAGGMDGAVADDAEIQATEEWDGAPETTSSWDTT